MMANKLAQYTTIDGLDKLPRYPCPIIVTGNKFEDSEAVAWELSKIVDKYLKRGYRYISF